MKRPRKVKSLRKAKLRRQRRKRCWGPKADQHARECRRGRPLCRWRRSRPCGCDRYHFPHRPESGRCGDEQKFIEWMMTPRRRAG